MDLTTTWCRIEKLIETAGQHILTIEQGKKRDYARAAREIKECMREVEELTVLATQLSQTVSDRLEHNARHSGQPDRRMGAQIQHGGPSEAASETPLSTEAALIDLTAEDAEPEGAPQQKAEQPHL